MASALAKKSLNRVLAPDLISDSRSGVASSASSVVSYRIVRSDDDRMVVESSRGRELIRESTVLVEGANPANLQNDIAPLSLSVSAVRKLTPNPTDGELGAIETQELYREFDAIETRNKKVERRFLDRSRFIEIIDYRVYILCANG